MSTALPGQTSSGAPEQALEGAGNPFLDFGAVSLIVLLGLQAMIVQIIVIRESIVVFQGNELCFGVVFAAWLAGIAIGANVGARIASRTRRGDVVALAILLVMTVLPFVQVYLIRIQRIWLDVPPGELTPFSSLLFSSVLTITPFSALVGLIPTNCSRDGRPIPGPLSAACTWWRPPAVSWAGSCSPSTSPAGLTPSRRSPSRDSR